MDYFTKYIFLFARLDFQSETYEKVSFESKLFKTFSIDMLLKALRFLSILMDKIERIENFSPGLDTLVLIDNNR